MHLLMLNNKKQLVNIDDPFRNSSLAYLVLALVLHIDKGETWIYSKSY